MNKKGIRNAAIQSLLSIPGEWGWRSGLTSGSQGARCPDVVQLRWWWGWGRRWVGWMWGRMRRKSWASYCSRCGWWAEPSLSGPPLGSARCWLRPPEARSWVASLLEWHGNKINDDVTINIPVYDDHDIQLCERIVLFDFLFFCWKIHLFWSVMLTWSVNIIIIRTRRWKGTTGAFISNVMNSNL